MKMNEEQQGLSRQLSAHEHFTWQPGLVMIGETELRIKGRYEQAKLRLRVDRVVDGQPCAVARRWLSKGTAEWMFLQHPIVDLSDYGSAAILIRAASEVYEKRWKCRFLHDRETEPDLGTAAAKALLAIWEPQG